MGLYRKAVLAWGAALPHRIKSLRDRSDDATFVALNAVMDDVYSSTWVADARIAWALIQGREPNVVTNERE